MKTATIYINDHKWVIELYKTHNSYIKQVHKENKETYGVTKFESKIIVLNQESMKLENKDMLHVLMHEIGHAWQSGLPAHTGWDGTSNVCADAFGHAVFYIARVQEIIKNFKGGK